MSNNVSNYFQSPGSGADNKLVLGGSIETSGGTNLKDVTVQTEIADISTTSSTGYVVAPFAGTITKIYTVIDGAITGGDAAITTKIGSISITDGGITIANAGSAAGDVDSATPTAANTVAVGDALVAVSDGGSTGATKAVVIFVIAKS